MIVNEDNDHSFKCPSSLMNETDLKAYIDSTCQGHRLV